MTIDTTIEAHRVRDDRAVVLAIANDWSAYYLTSGHRLSDEQLTRARTDFGEDYRPPHGPSPVKIPSFPFVAGFVMRLGWTERGPV